jgi:hypothetical protein
LRFGEIDEYILESGLQCTTTKDKKKTVSKGSTTVLDAYIPIYVHILMHYVCIDAGIGLIIGDFSRPVHTEACNNNLTINKRISRPIYQHG